MNKKQYIHRGVPNVRLHTIITNLCYLCAVQASTHDQRITYPNGYSPSIHITYTLGHSRWPARRARLMAIVRTRCVCIRSTVISHIIPVSCTYANGCYYQYRWHICGPGINSQHIVAAISFHWMSVSDKNAHGFNVKGHQH